MPEPIVILFAKDRAVLDAKAKAAAGRAAAVLAAYPLYGAVLTAGAASGERSPARLAARRAAAVAAYLTGPGRVPAERLKVAVKTSRRRAVTARVVEEPLPAA